MTHLKEQNKSLKIDPKEKQSSGHEFPQLFFI